MDQNGFNSRFFRFCSKILPKNGKNRYFLKFLKNCIEIIDNFAILDHFFWGLWGLVGFKLSTKNTQKHGNNVFVFWETCCFVFLSVQAKYSPIDFDFMEYSKSRLIDGFQWSKQKIYGNKNSVE